MLFTTLFATAFLAMKAQAQSWDVEGVTIVCDPETPNPADVISARVNAQYLGNIATGEQPLNGAGPENCGQVACNWGTSFEWCNDTPEPMQLDNFTVVADAFNLMNSKLTSGAEDDCVILTLDGLKVAGEVFHPDGFSVRIRGGVNC